MTAPLLYDKCDGIATVTLNRPERRNALSPEMICRLADAVQDVIDDSAVRVLVLTAAGSAAFCAGGDLALSIPLLSGERPPQDAWDRRLLGDPGVMRASTLRNCGLHKPVVAAINGHCVAAGMELLLGTDIRIAVPHARFALPEVRRGVIPFAGALVRLPREAGHCRAMQMLLTGAEIDAETALRFGLINEIVTPDAVLDRALAIATVIAANAPVAVQNVKRVALEASGQTLEAGFALEDQARAVVMATDDAREGPRAFLARRQPQFEGR